MTVDLIIGDGRLRVFNFAQARMLGGANVGRIAATVGETFTIVINDSPPGPLRWTADNDEVLDIADDNGPKATIKAATPGKSELDIVQRGRVVARIDIEVTSERASRLVGATGTPEQK